MKRIFIGITILLTMALLIVGVQAQVTTTQVYVHYYRYAGDYTGWNVWMWQSEPESMPGTSYSFVDDDTSIDYNYGGKVAKITLTGNLNGAQTVGLIIRRGEWLEKDIDADRLINIPSTSQGGIYHIYLVEGDTRIGSSITDPLGPDKSPKFKFSYFTTENTITFQSTETMVSSNISVKVDAVVINVTSIVINGTTGTITLPSAVDFSKKYVLHGVFGNQSTNTYDVTFDGIYDSPGFNAEFGYEGNDLGAIPSSTKTTFRLWAPVSSQVSLNLYNTGTPTSLGGTNTPTKIVEMTRGEKGTFFAQEVGNLHGTYYTYSVTTGSSTYEVVDPYAKSTGINGLRGLIVDFSQVNPTGFAYNTRANNMVNPTDAIIYELHVRDLSTHGSWNGTESNRGKFLGLIEQGTKYGGVATGFDHILDLGVTHIQILPFFDFGVVDETKLNDPTYNAFNWGYMPLHFNVLEGAYSSNPYDGLNRIYEFKQVVTAYTANNLRLNMDVVYNHTGLTANSNFNLIIPGYYHRKTTSGAFSNGSGTGNETASERFMMRKFMIESLVFWATEYNMSGFRFDLMALHDIETMNQIVEALHEIDPTIMIYGEPWMGGSTPLPANQQAGKTNLHMMEHVGAFNDDLRDGVKGSVFAREQGGWMQGDFSETMRTRVKYGIVGGIAYPELKGTLLSNQRIWHTNPNKTINYVTAHDNNTLYDKLYQTLEVEKKLGLIPAMQKQANAIVLTSQGVAFLHAGDEILRSKPSANGKGFDHNSYESPDSVNQIRWDYKIRETETNVYQYYKGLIELRKSNSSFRMTSAEDIINHLTFIEQDVAGVIAYTIENTDEAKPYKTILVAHNANSKTTRITLPKEGGWIQVVDGNQAGVAMIDEFLGGQNIRIPAHTTVVLFQDELLGDVNYTPIIIGASVGGTGVIGAAIFLFFKFRKKG
jgi:pullulanase